MVIQQIRLRLSLLYMVLYLFFSFCGHCLSNKLLYSKTIVDIFERGKVWVTNLSWEVALDCGWVFIDCLIVSGSFLYY